MVSFPAYVPSSACCYSPVLLFTVIVPLEGRRPGSSKGWLHSWWTPALAYIMPSGTSWCCPEGEQKAIHPVAACWRLLMELWVGPCYVAGAEMCSVPNPPGTVIPTVRTQPWIQTMSIFSPNTGVSCWLRMSRVWGTAGCFPVLVDANKSLVCLLFSWT